MPDKRRWDLAQDELIRAIFERHPTARAFSPCDCGIAAAIIPRKCFNPECCFLIDDPVLYALARTSIRPPFSNYAGEDGVLILGERA